MKRNVLLSVLVAGTMMIGASANAQSTKAQPKKEAHPAKVEKSHVAAPPMKAKLNEKAPDFTLTDLDGKTWNLAELTKEKKVVVLEWFNPDCPYSGGKQYEKTQTMNETAAKYKDKGVVWLAINSGADNAKSSGTKERNEKARKDWKINHPILLDHSGDVGMAYGSKNTPTMYVINADGVLVYWGAIDNDNSPNKVGAVNHVAKALDEVLAGQTVTTQKTTPYGCQVHYAEGAGKARKDNKK